jgi:Protein of unknown function (DUF1588)/Protein of unknown function (DUF1592)
MKAGLSGSAPGGHKPGMHPDRFKFRFILLGATVAGVVALGGCFGENHVLGDEADAGSASLNPGSAAGGGGTVNLRSEDAGTGGSAGAGAGGTTLTPDASTGGVTVVSLGDQASGGWLIAISPEEVARRLSQFLLQEPPSAALTAAVVASAPATNEDVGELTDGLLLEDGSLAGRQAFYRWWLNLDDLADLSQNPRDPLLFPAFTPDVRQALIDQTLAFTEDVTWRPQGDLSTLMTEPAAFVTTATAPWFPGVTVPAGTTATHVALDPSQYAGIFTQPAVVATDDDTDRAVPTRRGYDVINRYLCQAVPAPPPKIAPLDFQPGNGTTIRQALEDRTNNPACVPCHGITDPPGFAFGHFDAVGAYHDMEDGLAVDTTGSFYDLWDGPPISFSGAPDLASQLAALPEVRTCFAAQWVAFATGANSYIDGDVNPDTSSGSVIAPDTFETLAADADYVVERATIQGRLNLRGTIRAVTETHAFLDP